jgi:hypothetical protein
VQLATRSRTQAASCIVVRRSIAVIRGFRIAAVGTQLGTSGQAQWIVQGLERIPQEFDD